jgi:hypothetical protein
MAPFGGSQVAEFPLSRFGTRIDWVRRMNVNSITSQSLLSSISSGSSIAPAQSASVSTADGADLSGLAQFFSALKQLSVSNPSQFKQITAQISQQLNAAAQSATDPNEAQQLTAVANRFQQASQTGDFSSLLPQQQSGADASTSASGSTQGHHGHHHHHGGYSQASSGTETNTQDALASILANAAPQVQSALNTGTTLTS